MITGLPKTVTLTSEEIRVALKDATSQIVETVHGILEKTPPELAADIVDRGIVLTGGGALLHGMDTLIEQRTGVSTLTVQDAMSVVAVGTGKYAEVMARLTDKAGGTAQCSAFLRCQRLKEAGGVEKST